MCLVQGVSAGTGSGLSYFQVVDGLLGSCGHVGALSLATKFSNKVYYAMILILVYQLRLRTEGPNLG